MASRPSSTCTKTLITQPTTISQSSQKPACAPVLVVPINSPEPTMEPAMIKPGPRRLRMPRMEVGGVSTVVAFEELGAASEEGFAWDMRGERCEGGLEVPSTLTDAASES